MLLEPKSPRNSRSAALTTRLSRSVWWSTWKLDPATTVNKETTKVLNGAGADLEARAKWARKDAADCAAKRDELRARSRELDRAATHAEIDSLKRMVHALSARLSDVADGAAAGAPRLA